MPKRKKEKVHSEYFLPSPDLQQSPSEEKYHMLENPSDRPPNCGHFEIWMQGIKGVLKTIWFLSLVHHPASAYKEGGFGREKKFTPGSQREGFLGEAPHRPHLLDLRPPKAPSPAEVPLETLRFFPLLEPELPLQSPVLLSSSSGILGRQRPQ